MKLKLTKEQRVKLQALEPVKIAGTEKCPHTPGDEFTIVKGLTLRVLEIRSPKGGGWSLRYELTDKRDPVRNLRRTPGIFHVTHDDLDEHGEVKPPTAEELKRAAEQSAYTTGPDGMDAGEGVDDLTQRRFTAEAQKTDTLREQKRRERYEKRTLHERYLAAKAEAAARHIDLSHHERVIADRVDRMERALGKDRAA